MSRPLKTREREAAAALIAAGASQAEAAKAVGVSEYSLSVWKKDPRFQALEAKAVHIQMQALVSENVAMFRQATRKLREAIEGGELSPQQLQASITVWSKLMDRADAMFSSVNVDEADWYDDASSE